MMTYSLQQVSFIFFHLRKKIQIDFVTIEMKKKIKMFDKHLLSILTNFDKHFNKFYLIQPSDLLG